MLRAFRLRSISRFDGVMLRAFRPEASRVHCHVLRYCARDPSRL